MTYEETKINAATSCSISTANPTANSINSTRSSGSAVVLHSLGRVVLEVFDVFCSLFSGRLFVTWHPRTQRGEGITQTR